MNSSDVESLIFGDLLKWRAIEIKAKLDDAARLYEEIKLLEKCLFSAFISYILARAGFFNITILDLYPWDIKDKETLTTRFDNSDWVKHIDAFSCSEEFREDLTDAEYEMLEKAPEWTIQYSNDEGQVLQVKFLSGQAFWYFVKFPIEDITKGEEKGISWVEMYLSRINKSLRNYVVVHPSTYKQAKMDFKKLSKYLYERTGQQILFSVEGFIHKFFPIKDKKYIIKENWALIREKILWNTRKKWPIIVHSTHSNQLSDIQRRLKDATLKYEMGERYFEDAVRDAALACEEILQVIHEIYVPKSARKDMHFYDFLCELREIIVDEFGKKVYDDLDFIRIWRNKVSHTPPEKPNDLITFQVVERSKMFYEVFSKWSQKIKFP